MTRRELAAASWRKSTHSNSQAGACVEVARAARAVAVRDSKDPGGPVLAVSRAQWRGLLAQIKADRSG
ncbi:MAG TPA: DUF397 domain-containing protein [Streptosporangiaceae bacterium]